MATAAVLTPLVIPTTSRVAPLSLYPSSPIAQFPPPVPAVRRPLRERCGFAHNLTIHTSFSPHGCAGPWSPKGHIQPHRNHLPRRRKGQVKRIVLYEDEPKSATHPVSSPEIPDAPPKPEERHVQEIVPGLFLAFKLSDDGAEASKTRDEGYTHIVDICYPLPGYDSGSVEQAYEGRLHRLRLVLPPAARPSDPVRAALALNNAQLRAARDFLAQTLPYAGASASQAPAQSAAHSVRILVSTPARRPTDAMSVVGCYLAFASGKTVETALRCVDDEADFLSVWKGEVSEEEVERVERVARMWSWLSKVRR